MEPLVAQLQFATPGPRCGSERLVYQTSSDPAKYDATSDDFAIIPRSVELFGEPWYELKTTRFEPNNKTSVVDITLPADSPNSFTLREPYYAKNMPVVYSLRVSPAKPKSVRYFNFRNPDVFVLVGVQNIARLRYEPDRKAWLFESSAPLQAFETDGAVAEGIVYPSELRPDRALPDTAKGAIGDQYMLASFIQHQAPAAPSGVGLWPGVIPKVSTFEQDGEFDASRARQYTVGQGGDDEEDVIGIPTIYVPHRLTVDALNITPDGDNTDITTEEKTLHMDTFQKHVEVHVHPFTRSVPIFGDPITWELDEAHPRNYHLKASGDIILEPDADASDLDSEHDAEPRSVIVQGDLRVTGSILPSATVGTALQSSKFGPDPTIKWNGTNPVQLNTLTLDPGAYILSYNVALSSEEFVPLAVFVVDEEVATSAEASPDLGLLTYIDTSYSIVINAAGAARVVVSSPTTFRLYGVCTSLTVDEPFRDPITSGNLRPTHATLRAAPLSQTLAYTLNQFPVVSTVTNGDVSLSWATTTPVLFTQVDLQPGIYYVTYKLATTQGFGHFAALSTQTITDFADNDHIFTTQAVPPSFVRLSTLQGGSLLTLDDPTTVYLYAALNHTTGTEDPFADFWNASHLNDIDAARAFARITAFPILPSNVFQLFAPLENLAFESTITSDDASLSWAPTPSESKTPVRFHSITVQPGTWHISYNTLMTGTMTTNYQTILATGTSASDISTSYDETLSHARGGIATSAGRPVSHHGSTIVTLESPTDISLYGWIATTNPYSGGDALRDDTLEHISNIKGYVTLRAIRVG